ncbi:sugar phosphate nucleotidyltransferase [Candidatus Zixiibacteriota bacterium]
MRGVVLAGGLGRRLGPLTKITNKHLLPIWDRPMIYYPLQALAEAGFEEVVLVVGGQNVGDFMRLLGDGKSLGLKRLVYAYQEGQEGIAQALKCAQDFCAHRKICVVLGDNIFSTSLRSYVDKFTSQKSGARLLLKKVPDPSRFGVPQFTGRRIRRIVEKPRRPASPYAVTGIYFFDPDVFAIIDTLTPSPRGELEITDVSNAYVQRGDLKYNILPGWWTDAGTISTLHNAARLAAKTWARQHRPGKGHQSMPTDDQWHTSSARWLFADQGASRK